MFPWYRPTLHGGQPTVLAKRNIPVQWEMTRGDPTFCLAQNLHFFQWRLAASVQFRTLMVYNWLPFFGEEVMFFVNKLFQSKQIGSAKEGTQLQKKNLRKLRTPFTVSSVKTTLESLILTPASETRRRRVFRCSSGFLILARIPSIRVCYARQSRSVAYAFYRAPPVRRTRVIYHSASIDAT
jgi:hypothetical protein